MENKELKDKFKKFNVNQRRALQKIIDNLNGLENVEFFVGYWLDSNEFIVSQDFNINEHKFLNYYWCEYKKDNKNYKITMFYKDFDCGSGNIHVLPGAIQIWRLKQNCDFLKNGFCEVELSKCKFDKSLNVNYSMIGGRPYCEYGWVPLLQNVQFWDDEILHQLIENLKKDVLELVKKKHTIYSNQFYKDVLSYSKDGRSGHYMRYALLKFKVESLYYKTMLINGYGYFTKYDGEEVSFIHGNNENTKGPNYYDTKKGSWVIQKELFIKKAK